jgi:hypothetical protein
MPIGKLQASTTPYILALSTSASIRTQAHVSPFKIKTAAEHADDKPTTAAGLIMDRSAADDLCHTPSPLACCWLHTLHHHAFDIAGGEYLRAARRFCRRAHEPAAASATSHVRSHRRRKISHTMLYLDTFANSNRTAANFCQAHHAYLQASVRSPSWIN